MVSELLPSPTHAALAATLSLSLLAACASAPPVPLTNRSAVRVDREMDRGQYRYRVEGAAGYTQAEAREQAVAAALGFAAKQVTGDPREKTSATNYVSDNLDALRRLATPGSIFQRRQVDDHLEIGMYVTVRTRDLQRELAEGGVIGTARAASKALGRPTLMVVARKEDCTEGSSAPICTAEARIQSLAGNLEDVQQAVYDYQDRIIEAGCVDQEKVEELVEASGSARARAYGARVGRYRGFYRGTYVVGGGVASASASHRYRSVRDQVRNSPNCQAFVRGLYKREKRLIGYEDRLVELQDQYMRLLEAEGTTAVTTTKLNQYLVDQRLPVVDQSAIEQARRTQQALGAVSGLAEDPVGRIAQLAGADVYIEYGTSESTAGGGYQLELDAKAYDVVTGQLLASRVAKSRRLAAPDRAAAVSEAAGKVMPVVLDQIQGYWSDALREGARIKVVVQGDLSARKRQVLSALDAVLEEYRECGMDVECAFELGSTTGRSMEGSYVVPPKRRRRLGLSLEGALQDAGFGVEVVVSNPTLQMMRLF